MLNKIDLLRPEARRRLHNAHPDAVLVSARTGEGLDELEDRIAAFFAERFQPVELLVPHDEGASLADLYALGAPIEREDTADGVRIRAHLPEAEARRYDAYRVNGSLARVTELPVLLLDARAAVPARGPSTATPGSTCARSRPLELAPGRTGARSAPASRSSSRRATRASWCRAPGSRRATASPC